MIAGCKVPPGYWLTAYYASCYVLLGLTAGAVGPAIPDLATKLSIDEEDLGIVFLFRGAGWLACSLVSGYLTDHVRGHILVCISVIALAISMAVIPFCLLVNRWLLSVAFGVVGAVGGIFDVTLNTLIQWTHGEKVGPHMQLLHFGFGLGASIAPIIVGVIIGHGLDIIWTFWALAVIIIPLAIPSFILTSPHNPEQAQEQARLQKQQEDIESGASLAASTAELTRPVPLLMLLVMGTLLFCYVGIELGFSSWLPTYAIQLRVSSRETAPYFNTVFWSVFSLFRLLAVPLSVRLRPSVMLLIDVIGCTITSAILCATQGIAISLWVLTAVLGACLASIWPTVAMLPATLGLTISGRNTMVLVVGSALAELGLPFALSQIFTKLTYWSLPFAVLILAVCCLVLLLWMLKLAPASRAQLRLAAAAEDRDNVKLLAMDSLQQQQEAVDSDHEEVESVKKDSE